jgi:hypothetical protein
MKEARATLAWKSFGVETEFSLKRLLHPLADDFYHPGKRSRCGRVEAVKGKFHKLANGRFTTRSVQ